MKTQLEILNNLGIDLDMFYFVTIHKSYINLQGFLNQSSRSSLEDLGYVFTLKDEFYIEATKDGITITLTF